MNSLLFAFFLLTANQNVRLVAWNEDTVHSYLLVLNGDQKFTYSIIDSSNERKEYYGTFKYSKDTLHLVFKSVTPGSVSSYLLVETSGHYLIQTFATSSKRVFLRIQDISRVPLQFATLKMGKHASPDLPIDIDYCSKLDTLIVERYYSKTRSELHMDAMSNLDTIIARRFFTRWYQPNSDRIIAELERASNIYGSYSFGFAGMQYFDTCFNNDIRRWADFFKCGEYKLPAAPKDIKGSCELMIISDSAEDIEDDQEKVFSRLEFYAEFPGAAQKWFAFAKKHFDFKAITGTSAFFQDSIVLKFIVSKNGRISEIQQIAGNSILKIPAIKLLQSSPNWKPGTNGGRQLNSYRTLRIDIYIDRKRKINDIRRLSDAYYRSNN